MKKRLDVSIGQRLGLGFAAAALLLAILAGSSYLQTRQVAAARQRLTSVIVPRAQAADRLETEILYMGLAARNYMLMPEPLRLQAYERAVLRMREDLRSLAAFPKEPDGLRLFERLPPLVDEVERTTEALLEASRGRSQVQRLEPEMARAREELLQALRDYTALQHRKVDDTRRGITDAVDRMARATIALGALVLALLAFTGWLTARAVRDPAHALVSVARRLARGDFAEATALARDAGTGAPPRDELAELSLGFGRMAVELEARELRLRASAERLQAQNEQILAQQEELQAQHEEIQAQNEELQSQNEELQAQGEELQAQGEELRRTLERVNASEERYRTLFTHLSEGFALHELIYDDGGRATDFRFLAANAAFAEATGLDARAVVGKTVTEVIPSIERSWVERYAEVVRTGEPARFDDVSAPLGRTYRVIAFRLGQHQFATLFVDLTDQQRAAEALRAADRNKNEFLAVLSHELRNPLAPIRNSLYVLERATPGSERARRAQAVIDRQVAQLTRLVEDLLDVTRISRGKVQLRRAPVALAELVRQAAEDHAAQLAERGIELDVELTAAPVVDGDAVRLSQVIGNLLHNAVKFTPERGRVLLALEDGDGHARVRVRDTGAGMDGDTLGRLFQPFMQADATLARTNGGLGLGLALVKGFVEMHGGSVRAASDGLGKGSEIVVELPTVRELAIVADVGVVVSGESRRVLVVEDNVDAADSLREALSLCGHEVAVAYRGEDGIEKARTWRPDVLLCDIGLPDIDGHEVARAFRSDPVLGEVFLVALTGYALPEDLERASQAGFDEHLAKPPSMSRLEELLSRASRRAAVVA